MLTGKKTYLGAAMLMLNGLWGLAGCLVPDLGDGSPCDASGSVEMLAQGLGLLGLRSAVSRGTGA